MPQIFACPHCQSSFQVPDDSAGQSFGCPSCNQAVEVPAQHAEPVVFGCPDCLQGFGVTPDMEGETLACPHCHAMVMVSLAGVDQEKPEEESFVFDEPPGSTEGQAESTEEPSSEPIAARDSGLVTIDQDAAPAKKAGFFSRFKRKQSLSAEESEQPTLQQGEPSDESASPTEQANPPVDEFQPKPVDHLLPPKFEVPDPVRFPSRKDGTVLLPDGKGGYSSADPSTVTITHNGQVYHLKKMTPQQRQRRRIIHNSIAIVIALALLWLTLDAIGFDLLN